MLKGKITEEEKKTLKETYKNEGLFVWTDRSKKNEVVFRAINSDLRIKITDLVRSAEMSGRGLPISDVEQKIWDTCVIWPNLTPEEKLTLDVGTPPSVIKSIQEKSGFVDIDVFGRVLAPDTFTTILKEYDYWGDISEEDAEALKKECSPVSIARIRVGSWVFVGRPMTRLDMQIASSSNDDQLTIARSVTMWPKDVDWDSLPAGVIELFVKKIHDLSGWEMESEVEEL